MGEDYTVLQVEQRKTWESRYGQMQDYAIHIKKVGSPSPEEGWIQLSQKLETPPPAVNSTLHGYITEQEYGGTTYRKFKKLSLDDRGSRSANLGVSGGSSTPSPIGDSESQQQLGYIVEMLEELTGRRDVAHDQKDDLEDPFKDI